MLESNTIFQARLRYGTSVFTQCYIFSAHHFSEPRSYQHHCVVYRALKCYTGNTLCSTTGLFVDEQ